MGELHAQCTEHVCDAMPLIQKWKTISGNYFSVARNGNEMV